MPLRPFRYGGDDRVGIGISPQVLFIRLFGDLRAIFPCANVTFGMGNDVFECLLDSKHYFETQGLTWYEAASDEVMTSAGLPALRLF
mmetsp:Transcript_18691/g.40545  ORF Transcript_18691/g.40545 Transcript_18691/m.40545 type:complete len:87 (+) Transcript_18691:260-520(+)